MVRKREDSLANSIISKELPLLSTTPKSSMDRMHRYHSSMTNYGWWAARTNAFY